MSHRYFQDHPFKINEPNKNNKITKKMILCYSNGQIFIRYQNFY